MDNMDLGDEVDPAQIMENITNNGHEDMLKGLVHLERTLILLALCLVTLLTIFGNLFITLCIVCNSRLQRPGHFFIASLAITDLLLGLTVMGPRLLDQILDGWHFGYLLCQVSAALHKLNFHIIYFIKVCRDKVVASPKTLWV
jgi:hypothetical protein